jgi:hypothetical protein
MNCKCIAHVRYEANGDTIKAILDKIDFCPLHAAAPDLVAALEKAKETIELWNGIETPEMRQINAALARAKPHDAQKGEGV